MFVEGLSHVVHVYEVFLMEFENILGKDGLGFIHLGHNVRGNQSCQFDREVALVLALSLSQDRLEIAFIESLDLDFIHFRQALDDRHTDAMDVLFLQFRYIGKQGINSLSRCKEGPNRPGNGEVSQPYTEQPIAQVHHP